MKKFTVTAEFDLEASELLNAEERFHEFITNALKTSKQPIEFFVASIEERPEESEIKSELWWVPRAAAHDAGN